MRQGSAEVEEEGFGVGDGGDGEGAWCFRAGGVSGLEAGGADGDAALDELEPEAAAGADFMGEGLAGGEADAIDVSVLLDGRGAVASVAGDDEDFGIFFAGGVGMPLGVGGDEAATAGLDPDLEHVGGDIA